MTHAARDSFSRASGAYAAARPRYPASLYHWILEHMPGRNRVWDCATGNGQAAVDLSAHVKTVCASDISEEQIKHAPRRPNIAYLIQPAERTAFADNAFDAVTVAQALHWFDFTRFWSEVTRVLKPGGLFCAWGYAQFQCSDEVRKALLEPVEKIVSPHWSPNNAILWRGYREEELAFPFTSFRPSGMSIELRWPSAQLAAYMSTWSAYKIAASDEAVRMLLAQKIEAGLHSLGGDTLLDITMPLTVIAGRRP
jgi:SAM-dependent methyltransferase